MDLSVDANELNKLMKGMCKFVDFFFFNLLYTQLKKFNLLSVVGEEDLVDICPDIMLYGDQTDLMGSINMQQPLLLNPLNGLGNQSKYSYNLYIYKLYLIYSSVC